VKSNNENHLSTTLNDEKLVWEQLYDKFSAFMYGICLKISGNDSALANEILIDSFLKLKAQQTFNPGTISSTEIFKLTNKTGVAKMASLGIKSKLFFSGLQA